MSFREGRKGASLRAGLTWIFPGEGKAAPVSINLPQQCLACGPECEARLCVSEPLASPARLAAATSACYLLLQRSLQSVHSQLLLP